METTVKVDSVTIGVVKDLDDPMKLGRVRVALPHLGSRLSDWARLSTMMAGPDRGTLFRPELEDEVLVAFLHSDPSRPYILGALWNESDSPPENGGAKENHLRTIRSRSGHVVRFNDEPGSEVFEIISSSEGQRFVIDVAKPEMRLEDDQGSINVNAGQGDVTIEAAAANVTIKAAQTMSLEAMEINITGNTKVKIEGATVEIN